MLNNPEYNDADIYIFLKIYFINTGVKIMTQLETKRSKILLLKIIEKEIEFIFIQ
jgi:hypothetical protein